MEDERDPGFGEPGPDRFEVDVRGGEVPGRLRRHPDRGDAGVERNVELLERASGIVQRQVADREQAVVARAEPGHGAVQRAGSSVQHVVVPARRELTQRERREHQLRVDVEHVEHAGAHVRVECAGCQPPFRSRDDVRRHRLGALTLPEIRQLLHQVPHARAAGVLESQWCQPIAHLRVGVRRKPVLDLHQMAVGIEDHRHRKSPSSWLPTG